MTQAVRVHALLDAGTLRQAREQLPDVGRVDLLPGQCLAEP
jgi:hypothetical protein